MIKATSLEIENIKKSRITDIDFDQLGFGKVFSDHMLIASYKNKSWDSCKIVPFDKIPMSPALSALHYAQSIFEGLKAVKNKNGEVLLFRAEDNYKRMLASAERMCMPPIPEEIFMAGMTELIKLDQKWIPQEKGCSLYIRPIMFACDEFIGLRPSENFQFIIFTCPVGNYYQEPVRVKIETSYSRTVKGGVGYAKTAGNYAASLYAASKAQKQGYHQLVWTDALTHEYIEEAGTMNLFFQIGDKIITPAPEDTVLKGITRDSVISLAKDFGYTIEKRPVSVKEIIDALENNILIDAFGTGTAATVAPIKNIGYQDKDYELPPIGEREFSNKMFRTLRDIKYGEIPDKHGWITKIT